MKKLYFKEKFLKITDHYPILDEDGRKAYYLDQDFTLVGYKSSVSDGNGALKFKIKRELITFLPKYTISFSNGREMIIQEKLELFRHKIHVYTDNETLELKGDIFSYDFDIKNGAGKNIGTVNRKFFSLTDNYELVIFNKDYTLELIALVICLNNIIDRKKASANSDSNNQ